MDVKAILPLIKYVCETHGRIEAALQNKPCDEKV